MRESDNSGMIDLPKPIAAVRDSLLTQIPSVKDFLPFRL
jgi:hypothetical protein